MNITKSKTLIKSIPNVSGFQLKKDILGSPPDAVLLKPCTHSFICTFPVRE